MAILSNGKFYGFLCSVKETGRKLANGVKEYMEDFVSGFAGHGWKIWERVSGIWRIETDELVVRRTMIVFEMLISKIRCIKGALNISQGNGKIKTAELKEDGNWYITIEDEMSFVPHDFIRCQHFSNMAKFYWVEITDIINDNTTLIIPATEFMGSLEYKDGIEYVGGSGEMNIPEPGDEIIQFGNRINKDRQSAIYLHADEGGQPAIDILFNINSKSFEGCLNMRMGGSIPGEGDMKGFYCENGMIKGTVDNHVVYQIKPDGSAMFGDGSAQFNADKSGYIAGGTISWEWDESKGKYVCTMQDVVLTWDNLSDEAKENLKGDKGEDAVFYLIEFNEDGNTVQSISAIADGVPKGKSLKASLYKITSGKKELCGARRFTISAGSQIGEVIPPMGGGPLHTISIDYGDSSIQSYTVTAYGDANTVIALATIHKVLDGRQGEQGNPGTDANLLPWIEKWNGYATELGGDYIVTPKMFSGTKTIDAEGNVLLTGIAQGKECITIDGVKRTGIFALVDNEIVFELDPINKKYAFKGRVEAYSGIFSGYIQTPFIELTDSDAIYSNGHHIETEVENKYIPGYLINNDLNIASGNLQDHVILSHDKKYIGSRVNICNYVLPPYTRLTAMHAITVFSDKFPFGFYGGYTPAENTEAVYEISVIGGILSFVGVPRRDFYTGEVLGTTWICQK